MITPQDAFLLTDQIKNASTIYVLIGVNPNYDTVASALSLYLSFKEAGKNVQIACAEPMRVEFSYLIGIDEVQQKLGNRNLVLSFAYNEASVDKVSYHISEDGLRFNLVIAPRSGVKPLDPSTIDFTRSGVEADLVFFVGVSQLQDLGMLYEMEPYFLESSYSVAFTTFQTQPFARVHLNTTGQTCLAEGVSTFLSAVGMDPKDDIATNLLSSMEQATSRFQSLGAGPETFEQAARLMRSGARRSATNPVIHQPEQSQVSQQSLSQQQPMSQSIPAPQPIQYPQVVSSSIPPTTPASTSAFAQAMKRRVSVGQAQVQVPNTPTQPTNYTIQQLERQVQPQGQPTNPPQEWLQPKIFTGSTRV
ncbi:MAG TPA: hypothetical protein VJ246_00640 [Patescibacteria group bacterium]|nr:hypothetical protein [Patescibacteria group bacterium]